MSGPGQLLPDPVRTVLADARANLGERELPELLTAAAADVRELRGRPSEEQRAHARLQLERATRAAHRLSMQAEERRTPGAIEASQAMAWVQRLWEAETRRLVDADLQAAAAKQRELEREEARREWTW